MITGMEGMEGIEPGKRTRAHAMRPYDENRRNIEHILIP